MCHDEATKGAFPAPAQWHWKKHPFNIARGMANGTLAINQPHAAIRIGSCVVASDAAVFTIDDEELSHLG
jgi:hypothetical protein